MMPLTYEEIRCELEAVVDGFTDKLGDVDACVQAVKSAAERHCVASGIDTDYRNILELALRRCALHLTGAESNNFNSGHSANTDEPLSAICQLVTVCVRLAEVEVLTCASPVLLLTDCFDLLPVAGCQRLFDYVEEHVDVWKRPAFFNVCKNNILRMCNDLLRRQSQSQNTVFCGRVLLFLAKFFPLSERSGLNVISEFNQDNALTYDGCESTGTGSITGSSTLELGGIGADDDDDARAVSNLDYNFYAKFWSLQEFFRSPNKCYDNSCWIKFTRSTEEVLTVFAGYRDEQSSQERSADQSMEVSTADENSSTQYFAKFLTSPKLLHLQLMDATFRRFILVQFLILFDYLVGQVKFKTESQVLNGEQRGWLDLVRDRVYLLLSNTRPEGESLAASIRSLLQHERSWSAWKNDGCAAFTPKLATKDRTEKPAEATDGDGGGSGSNNNNNNGKAPAARTRRRRRVGDVLRQAHAKRRHLLGNAELSRLWNVCPDNMAACRSSQRDFLPSMEAFLEEATMQLDPASMVEPQYRLVNDSQFGWRALRLLSRRCSHYFAASQKIPNSQAEYLETILKKVAADSQKNSAGEAPPGAADGNLTADSVDELSSAAGVTSGSATSVSDGREDAGGSGGAEDTSTRRLHPLDEELVRKLAKHLADGWRRLAPKLGVQQREVDQLESEYGGEKGQSEAAAEALLTSWMERDGAEACQEELLYVLGALKLDLPPVRSLFHPAVVGDAVAN